MFMPPISEQDQPVFWEVNELFIEHFEANSFKNIKNKEFYFCILKWLKNLQEMNKPA